MTLTKNKVTSYLLHILKYIFACIYYLLIINILGRLIVTPIFIKIFNIDKFNLLKYSFGQPFNFINTYYKTSMGLINAVLQYALYFILFIGLIFILIKDLYNDYIDYKNNKEDRERSLLISLGVYFGLSTLTGFLVIALSNLFGVVVVSENQASLEAIASSSFSSYLILAFTVVIMGPLVEELIFRKALFKIIPNDICAIIISSILFGLMHTINFNYTFKELIVVSLPYISSGVAFGICYKLSKHNILMCYTLHAVLNLFSVFMML